jgi:murein DD-endopeptidase MepM/ murein hydrolase activator NlpD
MGRIASVVRSHWAMRFAVMGCMAASLAGCADSERLADPFSNPFQSGYNNADRTPTGSIAQPTGPVSSQPLPPPGNYGSNANYSSNSTTYSAPSHPSPQPVAYNGRPGSSIAGWTAEGGMPIVVAQGESSAIVARRYGIPEAALLRTNGFSSASQVRPGTRLIIPTYNAALAASSGVHAPHDQYAAARPQHDEHLHWVKGPASAAERAKAKEMQAKEIKHDEKIAKAEHAPAQKLEAKTEPKPAKIEKVALTDTGAAPEPKKQIDSAPLTTGNVNAGSTEIAASQPEFRWPARGRIIRGFAGNDGINIALPEGTPVKAVEAGVVAYAGNELKGYGNLILIRHANGFVSAYANTSEIDVKRGETVKRGQIIAKSGQTGNVTSPQLHFELRKGSKPVDPVQYLAGL